MPTALPVKKIVPAPLVQRDVVFLIQQFQQLTLMQLRLQLCVSRTQLVSRLRRVTNAVHTTLYTCSSDSGRYKLRSLTSLCSVTYVVRTPKTWHYPHLLLHAMLRPPAAVAPAVQQSIDISHQPGRQQQTRRTLLLQRAMGQTDTVPFHRPFRFHVDRSSNDLRAVLIIVHLTCYFVV